MTYAQRVCAVNAIILIASIPGMSGEAVNLKGMVIAYDPSYHGLKQPSFVRNLEVTIADVSSGHGRHKLVKVIFEGFGETQLSDDVLSGKRSFKVRAVRDSACDEVNPHLVTKSDSFRGSGTFLVNEIHRSLSVQAMSHLKCYRVRVGK